MRVTAVLALAALLAAPAVGQDDTVWPTPTISNDISALPKAVQRKRKAILAAAATGDIESLRALFAAQEFPPTVSYGAPDDGVAYLKDVSEDEGGRQMLGLLLDLFSLPYAWYPDAEGPKTYIWPYLADLPVADLTPSQVTDAYRLLNHEQLQELRDFDAWYYWRTGISESGEWLFFVAGD